MKYLFAFILFMLYCFNSFSQTIWTNETKLKGKIGDYPIVMTLAMPYGGASSCITIGEYYYVSKKKMISLCSDYDDRIIESVDGKETGYFIINDYNKKIGQSVGGRWYTMDGKKSYPVELKVTGKGKY